MSRKFSRFVMAVSASVFLLGLTGCPMMGGTQTPTSVNQATRTGTSSNSSVSNTSNSELNSENTESQPEVVQEGFVPEVELQRSPEVQQFIKHRDMLFTDHDRACYLLRDDQDDRVSYPQEVYYSVYCGAMIDDGDKVRFDGYLAEQVEKFDMISMENVEKYGDLFRDEDLPFIFMQSASWAWTDFHYDGSRCLDYFIQVGRAYDVIYAAGKTDWLPFVRSMAFEFPKYADSPAFMDDVESEMENYEFDQFPELTKTVIQYNRFIKCYLENGENCVEKFGSGLPEALVRVDEHSRADMIVSLSQHSGAAMGSADVAVLLPLSGDARKMGRAMLGAMLQAEGVYGGHRSAVRLHFVDTESSADKVRGLGDKIRNLHPVAILGPIDVRESEAAAKLAGQLQIPIITLSETQESGEYVFNLATSSDLELNIVADTVSTLGLKAILPVFPESGYSRSMTAQLGSLLASRGVTLHGAQNFDVNMADLSKFAKSVASQKFDAIFLPTSEDHAVRFLTFLAQENIWCAAPGSKTQGKADTRRLVTCIGTGLWNPLHLQSKFMEGAIYPDSLNNYLSGSERSEFNAKYLNHYHHAPALHEVLAYDGVRFLSSVYGEESAGKGASAIRQAKSYSGITGDIRFTENKVRITPNMMMIRKGVPEFYAPSSTVSQQRGGSSGHGAVADKQ